jgi:MFS family permease
MYRISTGKAMLWSACLGALFDGFDAAIYTLVLFPCIAELIHSQRHEVVGPIGAIVLAVFMAGWALGALVFGVISDRLGRVRTMTFTIFLYAISTGLCAFAHSWRELAIYRFLAGCGIGGEQGAGAIVISEALKGSKRYGGVAIMTASAAVGFLLSSLVNLLVGKAGWRYVFLFGLLPAGLAVYMRMKLKEPDADIYDRSPSFLDAGKELVCNHGRKMVVILCLASAAIVNWWAVLSWIPAWINQLTGGLAVSERSFATISVYFGAVLICLPGSFVLRRLGRQGTFMFAFAGALSADLLMFWCVKSYGTLLLSLAFFVGCFGALPFVCLFTIVPELFPRSIRGTAFGGSIQTGRLLAAAAALTGGQILAGFHGSYPLAASCVASINIIGILAAFFIPQQENYLSGLTKDRVRHRRAVAEPAGVR